VSLVVAGVDVGYECDSHFSLPKWARSDLDGRSLMDPPTAAPVA
jgi:hypothetical protein